MGDEPLGDVTHAERRELDALRIRAYGPDADIFDDDAALARLLELEDQLRTELFERAPIPIGEPAVSPEPAAPASGPEIAPGAEVIQTPKTPRAPRIRLKFIAGSAVAAAVIGAFAWSGTRSEPADEVAAVPAKTTAVADQRDEISYQRYLDGMRDDVLALPGNEGIANRMIRDQLRPYGTLYGRTVGSGPTVDREFCMIIADLPASSVTCIPIENANTNPVTVTLPSGYSETDGGPLPGGRELVSYTLMPGGSVVAVRADTL